MPYWKKPSLAINLADVDIVPGLWKLIRDSDYVKNIRMADREYAVLRYKRDIVRKAQRTRRRNKRK